MKLWQKKSTKISKYVEDFTIGSDTTLDLYLVRYDILASFAHALMLNKIGFLSKQEIAKLSKMFTGIYKKALNNEIKISKGIEDIHSQIEFMLTESLGDLGKKIHTGRSRNDQILVDLRLFARDEIQNIVNLSISFFDILINQSDFYKNVLMPGYTHTQVAMPSSFGLWFGSFAESLVDDLTTLSAAYKVCNQNPLGSGAGFGSSFPIDRKFTTELLGFDDLNYNVVYAQMTRGKFERIILQALSNLAFTLNKISTDICSYSNENYSFIKLPKEFTTGSSIMPHKKNPDVFELVRAYTNKIVSLLNEINMITNNLQSGYHRDFQLIKGNLIEAFKVIKDCIFISSFILEKIEINENILDDIRYDYLFTVEELNKMVFDGVAFRDAYKIVGDKVESKQFVANKHLKHTHLGSIGNLCNKQIKNRMNKIIREFNFKQKDVAIENLLKIMGA